MATLTIKTLYMGDDEVVVREDPVRTKDFDNDKDIVIVYKIYEYPPIEGINEATFYVAEMWVWIGKDPETDEEDLLNAWEGATPEAAITSVTKIALAEDEEEEDEIVLEFLKSSGILSSVLINEATSLAQQLNII